MKRSLYTEKCEIRKQQHAAAALFTALHLTNRRSQFHRLFSHFSSTAIAICTLYAFGQQTQTSPMPYQLLPTNEREVR